MLCENCNVNVKWVQGAGNKKVQQGKFATRPRKGGTLVILVLFVMLVMMILLTVVVMMMIAGTSGGQFVLPDPPVMLISTTVPLLALVISIFVGASHLVMFIFAFPVSRPLLRQLNVRSGQKGTSCITPRWK